jgi:hypothetical protein
MTWQTDIFWTPDNSSTETLSNQAPSSLIQDPTNQPPTRGDPALGCSPPTKWAVCNFCVCLHNSFWPNRFVAVSMQSLKQGMLFLAQKVWFAKSKSSICNALCKLLISKSSLFWNDKGGVRPFLSLAESTYSIKIDYVHRIAIMCLDVGHSLNTDT